MNDVNRTVARKLRSAAAALRADAAASNLVNLREALLTEIVELEKRADTHEEQAEPLAEWESDLLNEQYRRGIAAAVLAAMDVDQYLIDAVANARPS